MGTRIGHIKVFVDWKRRLSLVLHDRYPFGEGTAQLVGSLCNHATGEIREQNIPMPTAPRWLETTQRRLEECDPDVATPAKLVPRPRKRP